MGMLALEKGPSKTDLVQTLKLFAQQHLVCVGLLGSGDPPLCAWGVSSQLARGEIGCLCWTVALSINCFMLCLRALLIE